ncbi:MFS transporter [Streptomyces sp. NPDC056161]|uniref:MFS transporter n=1 Tax=Streptomyces sp. NPDC056161 TaxID=3345732 RepID=UPI0035D78786
MAPTDLIRTEGTAHRRTRGVSPTVLVSVLVFLAGLSTAVSSLGAPLLVTIVQVDQVSLAASQWALTVTLLVGAVAAPIMGRLGDGHHRRAATLAGAACVMVGCVLSAVPAGLAVLLVGRAVQGVGLGLVPLATAFARDNLPAEQSRRTIGILGISTAVGIGAGYPLVGLIAQYLGLYWAFWFGAGVGALALAAAIVALPASPDRRAPVDIPGAAILGLGVAGLLLVLAQGPVWGWTSPVDLTVLAVSVLLLAAWVVVELRGRHPLVDLRLLRHRSVLAANTSVLLVSIGFYPLLSLVVRFVQTPATAGYGFGAPVVVAGLLLIPYSLASLVAGQVARPMARRFSPEWVIVVSCVVLVAAVLNFLLARTTYWEIIVSMALLGFGVGCVFAVNPVQIVTGVPQRETGSAMSFYQLIRTVGYSMASALSATALIVTMPAGHTVPANSGYSIAALIGVVVLLVGLVANTAFALTARRQRT